MVSVLNTRLYDKNIDTICLEIANEIETNDKNNYCISATGAHGIITALENNEFDHILKKFKHNIPDGMPAVWVGRLKGAKEMQRCYGPDFFKQMMITSAGKSINHYLCGGKEGVADRLKQACEAKFNNYNIVGAYSPPFREMSEAEMKKLAEDINLLNTNIVWIGLSTPKQEKFAYRLSKFTNVNYICTVGAAFDFHIDNVKQAPYWIQKIGMEWFFRLCVEPKRLYKRYFEIVPKFIYYNLKELLFLRKY